MTEDLTRVDMTRPRARLKRAQIVATAARLFLAGGYASTSMDAIATMAGGSKQTLYRHFPSKAALFEAVMLERGVRHFEPALACLEGDGDFQSALGAFSRGFLAAITTEEALSFRRMVINEGRRGDLARLYFDHGPRLCWTRVSDHLRGGILQGRLRAGDPGLMAAQLEGLIEAGHYQRLLEGSERRLGAEPLAGVANAAVTAFLAAYGA